MCVCVCVCVYTMTVYSAYLWSPHKQLTACTFLIKGSRVNSQYVCSARMYYGHYHAIISHPRGNSSLPRKLMIVCELISLFSLSLFLSLFSLSPSPLTLSRTHTHTHTHTHSSRTTFSVAKGPSDPAPGCDGHV